MGIIDFVTTIFSAASSAGAKDVPVANIATGPLEATPGLVKIATIRKHSNDIENLLFPNGKLTPGQYQENERKLNEAHENWNDAKLWTNIGPWGKP